MLAVYAAAILGYLGVTSPKRGGDTRFAHVHGVGTT